MLQVGDLQLSSGVTSFITKFNKLSAPRLRPKLASAFHQFGWEMGTTTITQAGQIRHGKRIAVQATAAGRRRKVISRGKSRQLSGRPSKGSQKAAEWLKHSLSIRNEPKGCRIHSLQTNIQAGQQNAEKW